MQARMFTQIEFIVPDYDQHPTVLALLARYPGVMDWDHEGETWIATLKQPDPALLAEIEAL